MARADVKVSILDTPTFRAVIGRLGEIAVVEALRAIVAVPSERTLLLNAEARAMYEIAKRALREADRVLP